MHKNKKWQWERNHWNGLKITRDFLGLYANTYENLDETASFPGKYRWSKLIEIENSNQSICVEEKEQLIKEQFLEKSTRPRLFHREILLNLQILDNPNAPNITWENWKWRETTHFFLWSKDNFDVYIL